MPLTCVVVAAGASRRLGRPKQLLFHDGETLVHRAARIAREVAPTIVVLPPSGCLNAAIAQALGDLDVSTVTNEEAGEGMASSIRRGVAACDGDVLITLCDQPLITSEHLHALVEAHAPIAATAYSEIVGVPAFFSARFHDELRALRGDVGARRVIETHRDIVVALPFDDAAFDVDVTTETQS